MRPAGAPPEPYDLVFADPPYAVADDAVIELLDALRDNGWLAPGALVAVERATRGEPVRWPDGYDRRAGPVVTAKGRFGTVTPQVH